ncbi:RimK-like ATP-grasp domain-containing protein [Dyadobacter jejuensis]|uniref:RimK-like ATP-grasp domain-containing protein n=1 Tax=Dyadobacter jejuensis TaxID=1082580 RepID=A0A316ANS0_9BACT|nr:D-alanine--D-alanine ligase [Dyadobacter jejuensis]PWJ58784.1 RimK-like ATP-grasp domain-containing protein [Dyadobacter jejuensis]
MNQFLWVRRFLIRLFNWEYWPFNVVYAPMLPYYLFLAAKAKSFFFFNTANPLIKNGGFLLESKKQIYDLLPNAYYPKTLLFVPDTRAEVVAEEAKKRGIDFPFIAKPDIGQRGMMVKLVKNRKDLEDYLKNVAVDFLIQEYISYPHEIGIFYTRIPGEPQGTITGIVGKEFLTITGDGISSIKQLVMAEPRFLLQLEELQKMYGASMDHILAKGEQKLLVPYGNHSRGSKFVDFTSRADAQLRQSINAVCNSIPEFYFGRMDIKFNSWEELRAGQQFSIIELNGAGSEPTHMYDPKHSIFYAWGEIIKHLDLLYTISMMNHQTKGLPFMSTRDGVAMLKENSRQVALISNSKQA